MKDLSTDAKTSQYKEKLRASQGHSFTKTVYVDDNDSEVVLDDILYPISISKKGKKPKYANVQYTPAAAVCKFNVINKNGKYSPKNTASDYNEIFVRDRVVKFYDGRYWQTGDTETSESQDLSDSDVFHYYSKYDTDGIVLDELNTGGNTNDYFSDISDPTSYFVTKKDIGSSYEWEVTKLRITCNDTDGTIYYKLGNDETEMNVLGTTTGWTNGGATVNGDKDITINSIGYRYVWIAVVFDASDWGSTIKCTAAIIYYQNHIEWVLLGTFYLDEPDFNDSQSPKIGTINVTGRNAWKKALETKVNIEDLTANSAGGTYLDDLIEELADRAGINYTATSVSDLSSYGLRTLTTGYDEEEKIEKIYEDVMQIIGKDYRMYISDDNYLYVTVRPSTYAADNVFNYRRYLDAQQKFVSDTQLQRFGIVSSQGVLTQAQQLDSDTYNSTGDKTLTWSGDAIAKYIVYTVNSGDAVISDVDMNNESCVVTITGTTIDITIAVWGCKYTSGAPTYQGEDVDWTNMDNNDGVTSRVVNPLLISDAEAKTISQNFISEYGTPDYNIDLRDSYINALVEINDMVLVVSDDFFEDSLYQVQGIDYIIQNEVSKNARFSLIDTGLKFSDEGEIIYDRAFYDISVTPLTYDIGLIYDSSYPIGATEGQIGTSQYYTNVDCS